MNNKASTKIGTCICTHKQQDKLHGKFRRVMNKTKKLSGTEYLYRCTVCAAGVVL